MSSSRAHGALGTWAASERILTGPAAQEAMAKFTIEKVCSHRLRHDVDLGTGRSSHLGQSRHTSPSMCPAYTWRQCNDEMLIYAPSYRTLPNTLSARFVLEFPRKQGQLRLYARTVMADTWQFDEKKGPTWHCIVGRNFGSFVTHGAPQPSPVLQMRTASTRC